MQPITTQAFFPAVERALAAVGGRYNPHVADDSSMPLGCWVAFLAQLQEELGPEWGRVEERSLPYMTPSVAVPYTGPQASRRRLPIIFRHGVVAIEGIPMPQLRFNALTL